jgi:hypothetical protein
MFVMDVAAELSRTNAFRLRSQIHQQREIKSATGQPVNESAFHARIVPPKQ